jgi:SNW domain-containing protein 1
MRAQLEKKVAQREKEKQEDKLRKLAQKAREARAGIQSASEKSHDEKERDQMRYERHKDREKERRIAKAAPDKRYTRGCQLTLPIVYC